MPLVQAKCTNCGATLEVDNSKDAAICSYCGTPFIVEKAINNYSISADVVNVFSNGEAVASAQKEHLLKNAETFMSLGKFSEAGRCYREATQMYPDDYRGWWGEFIAGVNGTQCYEFHGLLSGPVVTALTLNPKLKSGMLSFK